MLNFHIIKVNLNNGEIRYRTILTKSGEGIKFKSFRRKQDARFELVTSFYAQEGRTLHYKFSRSIYALEEGKKPR